MPPIAPLLRATHLGPSIAVTAMVTGLAGAIGTGILRLVVLAGAVLTGQFTIGWVNDWVDRHDDRAAGRTDKPLATGALAERHVRTAIFVAVAACVVLSAVLGVLAGWPVALAHLGAVAFGLAYDLRLKPTVLSPLPYAGAFGLYATVAVTAPGASAPAWLVGGTALLATGAHFANTLPDVEHDARTGVRGLPQRMGPRRSAVAAALLLGSGAAVVAGGRGLGDLGPVGWLALLACAGLVVAVLVVGLVRASRTAFTLAMAAGGCVVVLLAGGASLLR